MNGKLQTHWDKVYGTKKETEVSWFQSDAQPSLDLLTLIGAHPDQAIIDVGGGASRLVDALVARGFTNISVLDLSSEALKTARARLGKAGDRVNWIVADATEWEPEAVQAVYDIWHDRAAFHFLTGEAQQRAYMERLRRALRIEGHVIIGAFALDGPQTCSGLPVMRHSAESLSALLGSGFTLVDARRHEHVTPWGAVQPFQFATFRRIG